MLPSTSKKRERTTDTGGMTNELSLPVGAEQVGTAATTRRSNRGNSGNKMREIMTNLREVDDDWCYDDHIRAKKKAKKKSSKKAKYDNNYYVSSMKV